MRNGDFARAIAKEAYLVCNAAFPKPIQQAYLYGSYARGDYHAESDIDILLTVDEEGSLSEYRRAAAKICSELSLKYDVMVSVTVKSDAQFRKYGDVLPFYRNVREEGISCAAG